MVILSSSFLPISKTRVASHTIDKVVRKLIGEIKGTIPAGTPIRLSFELDPSVRESTSSEHLRTLVLTTQTTVSRVQRPQFEDVDGGKTLKISLEASKGSIVGQLAWRDQQFSKTQRLGDWRSLLPPLIALLIALSLKRIVLALSCAVLGGAAVMNGSLLTAMWIELKAFFGGLLSLIGVNVIDRNGYLGGVISDSFNLQILGFTLALVGLVAVVNRMGGTQGLVNALSRFAKGPRSAQGVTCAMGTAIFFDDYANTVVVGTTARSLTDRYRVSREKLAYIVDSTSAPVAGIAIISTWIGYEVGLFDDLLGTLNGVPGMPSSGYELFFAILPFRFYCILALVFVVLNAATGRDYGPMYHAEKRARSGGSLGAIKADSEDQDQDRFARADIPKRALNAVIPIGSVLLSIVACIIYIGRDAANADLGTLLGWQHAFEAAADHIQTILLGSALLGSVIAILLGVVQKLVTIGEAFKAYRSGMKTLSEAAAILILAWAIKNVCDDLGTGLALVALVGDGFPSIALPFVIFVLSGLVAFSTGSSWATMALVLPIAAPLSATLSGETLVVFACLAAVLDGAIWGDHCSPISDTTILSSTSTACPHLEHVRTQVPYAITTMIAAGLFGYFGTVYGLNLLVSYGLASLSIWTALMVLGKRATAS
ncbi:MAG: Na+/H+ antiporter NhaC family protein [Bradymonadia bacterium]